jgi:hypothetical protein
MRKANDLMQKKIEDLENEKQSLNISKKLEEDM